MEETTSFDFKDRQFAIEISDTHVDVFIYLIRSKTLIFINVNSSFCYTFSYLWFMKWRKIE